MTSGQIVKNYIKSRWYLYPIGLGLLLSHTYLDTMIPKKTGVIIDLFTEKAPKSQIMPEIWMLLAMVFVTFWAFYGWRYILVELCRGIDRDLRLELFSHLQRLTPDFYVKNNTGDLITRSIIDVKGVRAFFGNYIVTFVNMIASLFAAIYFMQDAAGWTMTLICIAPAPLLVIIMFLLRTNMRRMFFRVQKATSAIGARVQENVTGIRVIKSFAQEKSEAERFAQLSRTKWKAEMKAALLRAVLSPIVRVIYAATFCAFLVLGGKQVIEGKMSIGTYTAFNGYIALVLQPMNFFGNAANGYQTCRVSMGRLNEVYQSVPSVNDDRADPSIGPMDGVALEFRDLTYHYPDTERDVLKNVSFAVNKGELVSVMGPTGCGKTTLANLIERLWEPGSGQIYLNGREIHEIPLEILRTSVAFVPQETLLFTDTIANNIRFFHPGVEQEDIEESARLAAVHESISSFPDGYDTKVGERGVTLSGGQKQRVAIARAAVTQPGLLLLDDSLSAVDTETEEEILENLRRDRHGCTVLLITHRISAAMLSDKVLFLDEEGRVSGFGPHNELVETNEAYRHLFLNTTGNGGEADA